MNRVFFILLGFLSLTGCHRTAREHPGNWDRLQVAMRTSTIDLGNQFYWTAPFVYKEEEIEEDSESVGIVALVGGIAGGATYEIGGGAGIAWGGTAIGLGLWEFVLVGALVGVAGYGIYSLFEDEEES